MPSGRRRLDQCLATPRRLLLSKCEQGRAVEDSAGARERRTLPTSVVLPRVFVPLSKDKGTRPRRDQCGIYCPRCICGSRVVCNLLALIPGNGDSQGSSRESNSG